MATLAVYRGDQFLRRVELGEGSLRIGRGAENGLVLEDQDKGVSRTHAEIRYERGRYVVIDLNSQNGVWLGNRRVRQDTLPLDTPLTVGPYRLVLESEQPVLAPPVAAPDAQPDQPVDVDDREASVERTDLAREAHTVQGTQEVLPPAPAPRQGKGLVIGLAVAGLVAAGTLAVVFLRQPAAPQAPPSEPTQGVAPPVAPVPPAGPTVDEQFTAQFNKARDLIAANDKTAAASENDAALKLRPDDPAALAQRDEIAAMVAPAPVPVEPAETPGGNPTGAPTGQKPPPGPPPSLRVARRTGESNAARANREKFARGHLDDGKKAFEGHRYSEAIEFFRLALEVSGQEDYGYKPNEARQLQQEARQLKAAADAEQRGATVQRLIDEAKQLGDSDVPAAVRKLREAQAMDPQAPGAAELMTSLLQKALEQGTKAVSSGKNRHAFKNFDAAISDFEKAERLLELVPGPGKAGLDLARERLKELRKDPK